MFSTQEAGEENSRAVLSRWEGDARVPGRIGGDVHRVAGTTSHT
jgi:hypothetical protein